MAILEQCSYGCGRIGKYKFKNGKICCENNISKCPFIISKIRKGKIGNLNPMYGRKMSDSEKIIRSDRMKKYRADPTSSYNTYEFKKRQLESQIRTRNTEEWKSKASKWMRYAWANGKIGNNEWKEKQKSSQKMTIKKINKKYPFFSRIEEMRYNPDKPGGKEIQVHCKNHNCPNSKEKGGWFTPTYTQLYERIRQIETKDGMGGCYFYCSDECKRECPLYYLHSDPFRDISKPYTSQEYQTFRNFVLERDNYVCQFCGEKAEHVHHERPQKLEPFFALDPDFAWSCCKKCHYEKGHKDECSTGSLASISC